MTELLKGTIWIVLIVCVGVMIYSIINAINTNKRNKATDETTRKIFLAKMQQSQNVNREFIPIQPVAVEPKRPDPIIPQEKRALDYDKYEEDEIDTEAIAGKGLKDFFG